MNTPLPFTAKAPVALITPSNDAVERMKKHAHVVLDLLEVPLTFEEEWHYAMKNAIEGMIKDMLKIVECETGPDLAPRIRA